MIRRVELIGDITYDGTGNPICVNGVPIAHREPTAAFKKAIKSKLIQLIEDELDRSIMTKGRTEKELFVRGSENDYSIAVVAKKDTLEAKKASLSDNPITRAIAERVLDGTLNLEGCKTVYTQGSTVRVNTKAGDFEVKITKKKERLV